MVSELALLAICLSGPKTETFVVEGVKRTALVFTPSKKTSHPPLVFGWHGHGGSAQASVGLFNVQNAWPDAVVVYPQGLNGPALNDPSDTTKSGWQFRPGDSADRDLKFFDAMYGKFAQEYSFNKKRVYSLGFSNGAIFTYLLWHARGGKFAAVGVVEGRLFDENKPLVPLPVFAGASPKDQLIPFADLQGSIMYCRRADGVAANAHPVMQNGLRMFHGSNADVAVMLHGQGHAYPAGTTQKVVPFFVGHVKP